MGIHARMALYTDCTLHNTLLLLDWLAGFFCTAGGGRGTMACTHYRLYLACLHWLTRDLHHIP